MGEGESVEGSPQERGELKVGLEHINMPDPKPVPWVMQSSFLHLLDLKLPLLGSGPEPNRPIGTK